MNSTSSRRIESAASVRMMRSPSSVGLEASGSMPTSSLNNSRDFSMTKHTFTGLISGMGRSLASILRIAGLSVAVILAPRRELPIAAGQSQTENPAGFLAITVLGVVRSLLHGHRFRQVARLVGVFPHDDGGMVGQHLDRGRIDDRREIRPHVRHRQKMLDCDRRLLGRVLLADEDEAAAAIEHF